MSLRDAIPSADDLAQECVEAWGHKYLVREMGAQDAVEHHAEVSAEVERLGGKKPPASWAACRLLARTLRDPDTGDLVFTEPGDAEKIIAKRSLRSVLRLTAIASRVCGFGEEEAVKTQGESSAVPSSASSSN